MLEQLAPLNHHWLAVRIIVYTMVFWPDDPCHAVGRAWIERQVDAEEQILVPTLARPEVAGPIRRRTGDHLLALRAVSAMMDLPGVVEIPISEELGELSGELAALLALKGGDAAYVALDFMERAPLVSWDREHLERCHSHVATRMPD